MTLEEMIASLKKMEKKIPKDTLIVMRTLNSQGSFVAIDVGSIEVTKTVGENAVQVLVIQNKKADDSSLFGKILNKVIKPFKG